MHVDVDFDEPLELVHVCDSILEPSNFEHLSAPTPSARQWAAQVGVAEPEGFSFKANLRVPAVRERSSECDTPFSTFEMPKKYIKCSQAPGNGSQALHSTRCRSAFSWEAEGWVPQVMLQKHTYVHALHTVQCVPTRRAQADQLKSVSTPVLILESG